MKSWTVVQLSNLSRNVDLVGKWQMPLVKQQRLEVDKLIGFNYCMTTKVPDRFVHFFLDDHEFERVWNFPNRYIDLLLEFRGAFTPDFSLYREYPLVVQLYNVFRNRLCGAWWQKAGIDVIPTIGWSDKRSYDFCFDGIEKDSIIAISSRGVLLDVDAVKLFMAGYKEMVHRVNPNKVLLYGKMIKGLESEVDHFPYNFINSGFSELKEINND